MNELELKISQKGCLCLYGINKMPVAMYKDQWQKVLSYADTIKSFIAEHDAEIKTKEESKQA